MNPEGKKENLSNVGRGRPKGAKNKFSNIKESFLNAFVEIGGTDALIQWAKRERNKGQFFLMITKLFPKEIKASISTETYEERLRRIREKLNG